jgi:hypothetical protein
MSDDEKVQAIVDHFGGMAVWSGTQATSPELQEQNHKNLPPPPLPDTSGEKLWTPRGVTSSAPAIYLLEYINY